MPSWFGRLTPRGPRSTHRRGYRQRPWWPLWFHQLRQSFRRGSRRRGHFQFALEGLEDRALPSGGITEYLVPTAGSQPAQITAGPDGALWFTESTANKLGRITTSGTFTEYAVPTANAGPAGITVGPDGALWFTEVS